MPPAAPHLLTRDRHRRREGGGIRFLGDLALRPARLHEFCGPARHTLALTAAAATGGPVVWIAPAHLSRWLNAEGMLDFLPPGRLLFIAPRRTEDLLWSMEEALRAGPAPLVIADLPGPPALTPIRRLHLAAEAGAQTAPHPPTGLILTPGDGGAPGIESRWRLDPRHDADDSGWHLTRLRARTEPVAAWEVGTARGGLTLAGPATA